jgi:hypothetical protein
MSLDVTLCRSESFEGSFCLSLQGETVRAASETTGPATHYILEQWSLQQYRCEHLKYRIPGGLI